jgi:hypothetical protein
MARTQQNPLIPAKAGTHSAVFGKSKLEAGRVFPSQTAWWIPAFAGMSGSKE